MSYEEEYEYSTIDIPDDMYIYDSYTDIYGREYRRIDNHEDYYISNDGIVVSFRHGFPRIIKTWTNQVGHQYVQIDKKKCLVHRLVANAFLNNAQNYPVVRHLDDNPWNNDYRNLAWGTQKENVEDMIRNGNNYRKEVYCYELDTYYKSCADAARALNVDKSSITLVCKGDIHNVKGYHFCYADEVEEKINDPNWLKDYNPYKSIIAIDKDGNRYSFNSRKEAARELGMPDCGISSVVNGHLKHTHGWRFEEGER